MKGKKSVSAERPANATWFPPAISVIFYRSFTTQFASNHKVRRKQFLNRDQLKALSSAGAVKL